MMTLIEKLMKDFETSENIFNNSNYKNKLIEKYGSEKEIPSKEHFSHRDRNKSKTIGIIVGFYRAISPAFYTTAVRAMFNCQRDCPQGAGYTRKEEEVYKIKNIRQSFKKDLSKKGVAEALHHFNRRIRERTPNKGIYWPRSIKGDFFMYKDYNFGKRLSFYPLLLTQIALAIKSPDKLMEIYIGTNVVDLIYEGIRLVKNKIKKE